MDQHLDIDANLPGEHDWFEASFVFGSYIVCLCGFQPWDQESMDEHTKSHNIKVRTY